MADLYIAFVLVAIGSMSIGWLSYLAASRLAKRTIVVLGFLIALALLLFVGFISDSLQFAKVLPVSSVMVLADLRLPLAALLIGLVWRLLPKPILRRLALVIPLLVLASWTSIQNLFPSEMALKHRWLGRVCLQTSEASCSAAAAATLLHEFRITATESEMAELCRTHSQGTPMLGLFRGLKLKAVNTTFRPQVIKLATKDFGNAPLPLVISVGLERTTGIDPRYTQQWGWQPGVKHSVVLFGFDSGQPIIGDPAVGEEHWTMVDLQILWHGDAVRLVPK